MVVIERIGGGYYLITKDKDPDSSESVCTPVKGSAKNAIEKAREIDQKEIRYVNP